MGFRSFTLFRGAVFMSVLGPEEVNVYDIFRRKYCVVTTGALKQIHAKFYRQKMYEVCGCGPSGPPDVCRPLPCHCSCTSRCVEAMHQRSKENRRPCRGRGGPPLQISNPDSPHPPSGLPATTEVLTIVG